MELFPVVAVMIALSSVLLSLPLVVTVMVLMLESVVAEFAKSRSILVDMVPPSCDYKKAKK